MRPPPLTPLAAAVLHVPAPERALVVACGEGDAALFLAREFPAARVRGVDSSAANVGAASKRVGLDPEGRIAFRQATVRHLPYPDDFFDLVAQLGGRPAGSELARVLSPGAHLILTRTQPSRPALELREKLRTTSLARHGFSTIRAEDAGDGSFLIAKLADYA